MPIPAPRLLALAALAFVASVVTVFVPAAGVAWIAVAGLAAVVALLDALVLVRSPSPTAERLVPASLAIGVDREVRLRFAASGRACKLDCFDLHPAAFAVSGLPRLDVPVPAGGHVEIGYRARPLERGDHPFGAIETRLHSPLGLWRARRRIGAPTPVRVYPNFAAIQRYTLLATDHRLAAIGILNRRRRGEGLDFQQLREYRQGDSLRQIDWKATARTAKLISREYQDERNQQIVFLLDCGRRMAAKDGPLAHFDHCLDAALLLAWVGLRQGDAVGLLTMGTDAVGGTRWFAPRRAASTVNLLLETTYDLQPTLATADYHAAAVALMMRLRKRALVVLLTNLRDEDDAGLMSALGLLRSRHLVLVASLREAVLDATLAQPVRGMDDALVHAETAAYLAERERTLGRMGRAGALVLDVPPERLAVTLVNRYLDVKRSGRL